VHDNDIILDFFAGSGTTAHAVMELNAEDGGNRQFICVQMPEPTDEKSEAYKAGYQTIAAITRARIQKVQAKLPFRAAAVAGGGVKFYKLQPSNFKIWQSDIDTEEELLKQLEIYAQPHTEAETPEENLLTELILKAGFMLTANVQTISSADGIKLYDIENGTMTVALSTLSEKVILTVCERKPKEFICLDNLFESDVQKSNWSLQLAEAGVNLQVI
jgi:adenine-specific DNA-methyltransferase